MSICGGREEYDVVVVGGGPAGCTTARFSALRGAKTLILEEHASLGNPVQCAGLVSKKALEESGIREKWRCIASEVKGVVAYSPFNTEIHIPYENAVVIHRAIFDRLLAESAVRAGAEIQTHAKVVSLHRERSISILKFATPAGFREIRAKVVVGADGVCSVVARSAGLNEEHKILSCVQAECAYEHEWLAEVFVGRKIAPGFFAWSVPAGECVSRVGLCVDPEVFSHSSFCTSSTEPTVPLSLLSALFRHPVVRSRSVGEDREQAGGRVLLALNAGAIPLGLRSRTVSAERGVLLVGDAACQVKPISGGGVFYALKCGRLAGEKAAEAALSGDFSVLSEYEREWRRLLGGEISFGLRVHRLRCMLTDAEFEQIFSCFKHSDLLRKVSGGDMDFPSVVLLDVLREFLRRPSLLKLTAKSVLRYVKFLLGSNYSLHSKR